MKPFTLSQFPLVRRRKRHQTFMSAVEGSTRGNIFLKQLTCLTSEFERSIVIQRYYTLVYPQTLSLSVSVCRIFVLVVVNMSKVYK